MEVQTESGPPLQRSQPPSAQWAPKGSLFQRLLVDRAASGVRASTRGVLYGDLRRRGGGLPGGAPGWRGW